MFGVLHMGTLSCEKDFKRAPRTIFVARTKKKTIHLLSEQKRARRIKFQLDRVRYGPFYTFAESRK